MLMMVSLELGIVPAIAGIAATLSVMPMQVGLLATACVHCTASFYAGKVVPVSTCVRCTAGPAASFSYI